MVQDHRGHTLDTIGRMKTIAPKLCLADELAGRALGPAELAARVGADPVALHRFLRLLAGVGVLAGDKRDGYTLTESGNLLRTNVPGSMRDLAISYGELFYPVWVPLDVNILVSTREES